MVTTKKKLYFLDTNILIHDPEAIYSFAPHTVGITTTVLEELDHFKSESTQRGRNAREAIRHLDDLRKTGHLNEGVPLEEGGTLKVFLPAPISHFQELGLDAVKPSADNIILLTALLLQKQNEYHLIFLSKDINMRVKADVYGLETQDYVKNVVSKDNFYKGWTTAAVPSIVLKRDINNFLREYAQEHAPALNEYILVQNQHNEHINRLFRYLGNNTFKEVLAPQLAWPIRPRNPQQLMSLDLLLDDEIKLVMLMGPAGTGKTFLTLVAGLHKVLIERRYNRMLISRPVIPLGPDIGYLPGDVQEKLHSWMQPIYDNMDFIMTLAANPNEHSDETSAQEKKKRKKKNTQDRQEHHKPQLTLDQLIHQEKVSLEAITYMRGRSIPYQYIFIDEVQNLTPHEVKTIVSRVGEGSKIILAGDPYQIDSPYLDFLSNGLMVAAQTFKGQSLCASAFLQTSERSELSKLAGELL